MEVYPALWLASGIDKSKAEDRETQVGIWPESVVIPDQFATAIAESPDAPDATAAAIGLAETKIPGSKQILSAHPEAAREGWIVGPTGAE